MRVVRIQSLTGLPWAAATADVCSRSGSLPLITGVLAPHNSGYDMGNLLVHAHLLEERQENAQIQKQCTHCQREWATYK